MSLCVNNACTYELNLLGGVLSMALILRYIGGHNSLWGLFNTMSSYIPLQVMPSMIIVYTANFHWWLDILQLWISNSCWWLFKSTFIIFAYIKFFIDGYSTTIDCLTLLPIVKLLRLSSPAFWEITLASLLQFTLS